MSHVTVHFVGICTHISQSTLPALPAQQRVVLVNARHGYDVREMLIPPHEPGLKIGTEEPIALRGCTVRLVTAKSPSATVDLDKSFQHLPNLTNLMEGLTDLGAPSPDVVLEQNAERSACYFDIDFGTLSACRDPKGAAIATLEADSSESISLEITPWDNSFTIASYTLDPDAIVWVANTDPQVENDGHRFADFLLHYVTAAKMPHTPQVPQLIALPQCGFTHPYPTVGAGCSNSNYP